MTTSDITLNSVFVVTDDDTSNPQEWAAMAVDQILQIGETLPEPLRSQAIQFKQEMAGVIANYIAIAIEADRVIRG